MVKSIVTKIEIIENYIVMTRLEIIITVDQEAEVEIEHVVGLGTMKHIVQITNQLEIRDFTQKIHALEIGDQFMKEEDIQDPDQERKITEIIGVNETDPEVTKERILGLEDIAVPEVALEDEETEMIFIPEDLEQPLIRLSC